MAAIWGLLEVKPGVRAMHHEDFIVHLAITAFSCQHRVQSKQWCVAKKGKYKIVARAQLSAPRELRSIFQVQTIHFTYICNT
jgi:hypothetical protein